jgi:NADPH:quinone reductase-like Zn-dependent oxidoreductase
MASMKAVRIHAYGAPDVLTYEDAPRPTPAEGEILIRVHASTVNGFDCAARAGYLTGYYAYELPTILGLDVSGVVEAAGSGVTGFAPGDTVYARADPARNGAYAEYVSVATSEAAAKPTSLDHNQAAGLAHAGVTARLALFEMANLAAGQTILIHAAAGGVGHMAVQLAKLRGAKVIGTASTHIDFLKELGVDEAIDYNTTAFEKAVKDVDVVLDLMGGDTQERSWSVLKPGGLLLSPVQFPSPETAAQHGVRAQMVASVPPVGEALEELASLADSGQIRVVISSILPLQEIRKAHEMYERKDTKGKIALQIAS